MRAFSSLQHMHDKRVTVIIADRCVPSLPSGAQSFSSLGVMMTQVCAHVLEKMYTFPTTGVSPLCIPIEISESHPSTLTNAHFPLLLVPFRFSSTRGVTKKRDNTDRAGLSRDRSGSNPEGKIVSTTTSSENSNQVSSSLATPQRKSARAFRSVCRRIRLIACFAQEGFCALEGRHVRMHNRI